ncbi:MAG: response regulator [Longimicrobiales bacterium]
MSRILVVEDQKLLRRHIRTVLEDLGHAVVTAQTADEGLHEARNSRFDLIVTDVFTPGSIDGLKLLVRVHHEAPSTKFILMSGSAVIDQPDTIEAARRIGVEYILAKPFSPEELNEAVHQVLGLPIRPLPIYEDKGAAEDVTRVPQPKRTSFDASGSRVAAEDAGPKMVILLEDNDTLRELIGEALAAAEIDVLLLSQGDEVLTALEETDHCDLLISDVFVPGMNGLELAMRVRHHHPDVAIMLMSGSSSFRSPEFEERAHELGVSALLPKPFSSEEFWAAVSTACPAPDEDSVSDDSDS